MNPRYTPYLPRTRGQRLTIAVILIAEAITYAQATFLRGDCLNAMCPASDSSLPWRMLAILVAGAVAYYLFRQSAQVGNKHPQPTPPAPSSPSDPPA